MRKLSIGCSLYVAWCKNFIAYGCLIGFSFLPILAQAQSEAMPPRETIGSNTPNIPARPRLTQTATVREFGRQGIRADLPLTISESEHVLISTSGKTLKFPLPDSAKGLLERVGAQSSVAPTLSLSFEGMSSQGLVDDTGAAFDLFINLPTSFEGKASRLSGPYYLRRINVSPLLLDSSKDSSGASIVIELQAAVPMLRAVGAWSPDEIEVSFVPTNGDIADAFTLSINVAKIVLKLPTVERLPFNAIGVTAYDYKIDSRSLTCVLPSSGPVGLVSVNEPSRLFSFAAILSEDKSLILVNESQIRGVQSDQLAFTFYRECALLNMGKVSSVSPDDASYSASIIKAASCVAAIPTSQALKRYGAVNWSSLIERMSETSVLVQNRLTRLFMEQCLKENFAARVAREAG